MRTNLKLLTTQMWIQISHQNFTNYQKQFVNISKSINYKNSFKLNINRKYCENETIELTNCWNCKEKTKRKNQFFCDKCGSLQDSDKNYDHFKLLSVKGFNIKNSDLTRKFRELQNFVHPDKFSNRTEREKTNSQEWSSMLNKAYKTLSVPIDRGEYLLGLHGIRLPRDNSVLNHEFLMEMMERNEEVEEADQNNILQLLEKVREDLNDDAVRLQNAFDENKFEDAKFILIKMKYFKSLEKNIKEKAIELGAVK